MSSTIFLALCGAAVVGLLAAERRDSARLRRVFKPAASLAFVLAAVAGGASATLMGTALLAGLILSAIGDVLLIPRRDRYFLMGVAAFGLGHLAYSGAFAIGGVRFGLEAASAAGLTLAAGLFFLRPLRAGMGAMAGPVAGYVLIISAMVGLAVGHHVAAATPESLRLAVGATLFAISDLTVARDQFGKRAFVNKAVGLPLYYGGQCLIASAV